MATMLLPLLRLTVNFTEVTLFVQSRNYVVIHSVAIATINETELKC